MTAPQPHPDYPGQWTCRCLINDANAHRGDCPDWMPLNRDGDWRGWTWVRRGEVAP